MTVRAKLIGLIIQNKDVLLEDVRLCFSAKGYNLRLFGLDKENCRFFELFLSYLGCKNHEMNFTLTRIATEHICAGVVGKDYGRFCSALTESLNKHLKFHSLLVNNEIKRDLTLSFFELVNDIQTTGRLLDVSKCASESSTSPVLAFS